MAKRISFQVCENTLYDNFKILYRFAIKIKDNTNRLENMIDDLKLGLEAYQEINNNKTKRNKNSIEIIQEKHKQKIEKLENNNDDANDKFRVLE